MKKHKRYEIENFDQLINVVNEENFERISIDFLLWLNHIKDVVAKVRAAHHEFKDKPNSEILKCKFIWIDDGKHELKKTILKNNTTGEVTEIKPKQKKNGEQ